MKFAAQVKVKAQGGTVVAKGDKISLQGVDAVTLYLFRGHRLCEC